ncbi:MAG: hypothetical protein ACLGGV_00215 [Bacteroidia bacterium]
MVTVPVDVESNVKFPSNVLNLPMALAAPSAISNLSVDSSELAIQLP